ncbi:MAG: hypothetical protein DBX59_06900 [Bacillota bacterium]|nr:MAG: hypothetical protein DBX59_06900 [Bacillota bacterium]
MSYYETSAEKTDYFFFEKRTVDELPAHFHSRMELLIVEQGELNVSVGGEKRTLRRGDVCFCDGFSVHAYGGAKELSAYVMLCDKAFFAEFTSRYAGKIFPPFFRFDNFPLLAALYESYLSAQDKALALAGVCGVLSSEFLKTARPVPRRTESGETLVCKILEYIEKHSDGRISLPVLAATFGYSEEHVSRTFSKYVGSLPRYVNRVRAEKAHRLLAEDGRTVSDAAYACGFESLNTFYRAYNELYGAPPRAKTE